MPDPRLVTIAVVEDDPGHALLIEKNLRRANISNQLVILRDGQEATDYLFCEGPYEDSCRPTPLLVLLDLRLPILDGFRVLERLKTDERTKHIPVIVLTSTDDDQDVSRCYELGCNVFMQKPISYTQFSEAIRKLGLFMAIVLFPQEL